MKSRFILTYVIIILGLASCFDQGSKATENTSNEAFTVYLVRHAEKADSSQDPDLTPEGMTRSTDLTTVLKSANIDMIHSTDFTRTMKTAQPTSDYFKIPISKYDHKKLPALAEYIKDNGGKHLVVGHSNSTPSMVKLLGGDPGLPINEKEEYDRIYIITRDIRGETNSVMLKYGAH
ncbi:MAG: histidine phosphatase family protein [Saprospiraceae bacterium]|nr:histidine phosphatase family protein [Saprospiraceae bacterium]